MKTIDATPTWAAIMPLTLQAYKNAIVELHKADKYGKKADKARETIRTVEAEIMRLCTEVDKLNGSQIITSKKQV